MPSKRSFTRPVLGDIVEIPLTKGFAYAQYVYYYTKPPRRGALLRILPGAFRERPVDVSALVNGNERFVAFFPLAAAVNQSMVSLVGHADVPARFATLPVFKLPGAINAAGIVLNWWLSDGEKEWRPTTLSPEEMKYPLLELVSFATLVKRIESGWKPEDGL